MPLLAQGAIPADGRGSLLTGSRSGGSCFSSTGRSLNTPYMSRTLTYWDNTLLRHHSHI